MQMMTMINRWNLFYVPDQKTCFALIGGWESQILG